MIWDEVILSEKPPHPHQVHRFSQIMWKVNMGLSILHSLYLGEILTEFYEHPYLGHSPLRSKRIKEGGIVTANYEPNSPWDKLVVS